MSSRSSACHVAVCQTIDLLAPLGSPWLPLAPSAAPLGSPWLFSLDFRLICWLPLAPSAAPFPSNPATSLPARHCLFVCCLSSDIVASDGSAVDFPFSTLITSRKNPHKTGWTKAVIEQSAMKCSYRHRMLDASPPLIFELGFRGLWKQGSRG